MRFAATREALAYKARARRSGFFKGSQARADGLERTGRLLTFSCCCICLYKMLFFLSLQRLFCFRVHARTRDPVCN